MIAITAVGDYGYCRLLNNLILFYFYIYIVTSNILLMQYNDKSWKLIMQVNISCDIYLIKLIMSEFFN